MAAVETTLMYICFVTLILSFPGNIFILVVNIIDFFRNRKLPLSDQLIFGFSAFSLLHGLHEGYAMYNDLYDLIIGIHNDLYDLNINIHTFMYLNLNILWFSTLLSMHFCLKIVNINHWFYICLQKRFPKLFPWIVLAFLPGYFFLILYSALNTKPECLLNSTSKLIVLNEFVRCSWLLFIFLAVCFLCTFLCSVSASTILISLCKHMERIQENIQGSRSPNIEAHVRAVKTVTMLLAANILLFASVSVLALCFDAWVYLFGILNFACYIFASYFLIKGTKKLDMTLAEILKAPSKFLHGINCRYQ
ncbi:taste receptor type 2 member 4-like [Bufo bufo]|uniref:taste receptor type 2 member 4-like n=1 Tax=Bufo bufo TaxID=8384 RepID=UPI001ABE3649|nr:taste receptor type 2 member 4-like [Bufo bufo]